MYDIWADTSVSLAAADRPTEEDLDVLDPDASDEDAAALAEAESAERSRRDIFFGDAPPWWMPTSIGCRSRGIT